MQLLFLGGEQVPQAHDAREHTVDEAEARIEEEEEGERTVQVEEAPNQQVVGDNDAQRLLHHNQKEEHINIPSYNYGVIAKYKIPVLTKFLAIFAVTPYMRDFTFFMIILLVLIMFL